MAGSPKRTSRAQQRRATEARILDAARRTFSEAGYDRATIRAVAAAADVDPGLVMHYFGSKKELFQQAARLSVDIPTGGSPEQVAEATLTMLRSRLEQEPVESLAVLRSMLTHPEAVEYVREAAASLQAQIGDAIGTADAQLRASLINAIVLGVVIGRYQIQLDYLRDASSEDIIGLLRPCFHALTHG